MKLIAVIGATGTGKSQLSVELCRAFNGEVINADLVQMYKRLPTFSNKLSVEFSSASIGHCSREDGLNLDVKFLRTNAPSLHLPPNFPRPEPSESFCQYLDKIMAVWVLNNEKSCRTFIDALLTEVLMDESNEELMGF